MTPKQPAPDAQDTPIHANIYQAMNAVMAEVYFVQKKKSAGLTYTFAGETTILDMVRDSMVKHGIVMYPAGVRDLRLETYTTTKGNSMNRVVGIFSFIFAHAPSGTTMQVETLGEGADSGDKSANKAMTGAKKYALLQSLLLRAGDDPDEVPSSEQERRPAAPPLEKRHWSENQLAVTRFGQYMETNNLTVEDLIVVFGVENLFELPDDSHAVKAALETYLADKYANTH